MSDEAVTGVTAGGLPPSDGTPGIRVDYTDQAAWEALRADLRPIDDDDEPGSFLDLLDDPAYHGLTVERVIELTDGDEGYGLFVLLDTEAMNAPGHPVLVVDIDEDEVRTLRVAADVLHEVEANLFLANMDFEEFADAADDDGVFRGF
ncbi:hypothetical protein OG552_33520 [Streptomyces sp. NBC_01476]|uniref:DUF6924 domain-containing protein n=1 Tax=Streptomyces sp. NBC_01476 TaxID=2903881 RepID=UPI002E36F379|nr:hypothetical protein [Streptomyces sp. NBC_01476]